MSRKHRAAREKRRRAALRIYWNLVERVGRLEKRRLATEDDLIQYALELQERGVIVDLGPNPSGKGRSISFRLDELDREGTMIGSLDELLRLLGAE